MDYLGLFFLFNIALFSMGLFLVIIWILFNPILKTKLERFPIIFLIVFTVIYFIIITFVNGEIGLLTIIINTLYLIAAVLGTVLALTISYLTVSRVSPAAARFIKNRVLLEILVLLDGIWYKKPNQVVFDGTGGAGLYKDNSRYLFERFQNSYDGVLECLWLTSDKGLISSYLCSPEKSGQFINIRTYKGIMTFLESSYLVNSRLAPSCLGGSSKKMKIQLWHGAPIKCICSMDKSLSPLQAESVRRSYERQYDYWAVSSEDERKVVSLCTGLPEERVVITGYPRNDKLSNPDPNNELLLKFPFLSSTIILYAPTWRAGEEVFWFPFDDMDYHSLTTLLKKHDAFLILRGHLLEGDCFPQTLRNISATSDRIVLTKNDDFPEVNDLLNHVDILISDYSGIWIDYLLLNRPIIFIPYDLDRYKEVPGLMYDYNEITPGPKINSFSELVIHIERYLEMPEADSGMRAEMIDRFHTYRDGKSYERLFQLMMKGGMRFN